jgi:hypothetical protein
LDLGTDEDFGDYLARADNNPNFLFLNLEQPYEHLGSEELVYSSKVILACKKPLIQVFKDRDTIQIFLPTIGKYFLHQDHITVWREDNNHPDRFKFAFLSTVLALWLEWQGKISLHASAVEWNGKTIGFLSQSSGGKSTLAASFVSQGLPLISDDILPIEYMHGTTIAYAGYPRLRLRQELVEFFFKDSFSNSIPMNLGKLNIPIGKAGFGRFSTRSQSVAGLFILERKKSCRENEVILNRLSLRDAAIELIRNSYLPHLADAIGLRRIRVEHIFLIASSIPIFRISYPDDLAYLPEARDNILRILTQLGRSE